jgi:LmbE family N-acetylglucosaminyl deacetylase
MRKPEWVFSFDGDYPPHVSHGDHRSAGQATAEAVRGAAAKWLMLFATRAPNYTADVSDFEDAQKAYLSHHRSQFYGEKLERVAATVESEANEEGEKAGFTFGVAFRALRP